MARAGSRTRVRSRARARTGVRATVVMFIRNSSMQEAEHENKSKRSLQQHAVGKQVDEEFLHEVFI